MDLGKYRVTIGDDTYEASPKQIDLVRVEEATGKTTTKIGEATLMFAVTWQALCRTVGSPPIPSNFNDFLALGPDVDLIENPADEGKADGDSSGLPNPSTDK